MHKKNYIYLIILINLFSFSCKKQENKEAASEQPTTASESIKYARGFTIEKHPDYIQVKVENPDNKTIYGNYYLIKDASTKTPNDGNRIRVPIETIAATSCTHFEFFQLLGELDKITGICEKGRIFNNNILNKLTAGEITDLGDSFNINYERLLKLSPSAIMVSGLEQPDENNRRITQSGIPVLYNNEWMEASLLGRAEWIKFVAAFLDKSSEADSIFNAIERNYLNVCKLTENVENKPTIMSGSDFRGTWYAPGGKSHVAELYRNGGGTYFYQENTKTGSIPLTFESALKNFSDADIWLWCTYSSMKELTEANEKHRLFKAYQTGNVYNNMNRITKTGGNDFWESAVARPDIVLKDIIKILHPQLVTNHDLYYFKKLN